MTLVIKLAGVILFILIAVFFSFRNYFLNKGIEKIQAKFSEKYNTQLHVGSASFVGISGLHLSHVSLKPVQADTLFALQDFSLEIKFWYALLGEVHVKSVHMSDGYAQLIKKDGIRNFDAFLGKDSTREDMGEEKPKSESNYSKKIYRIISKVLNLVPQDLKFDNFAIRANDEGQELNFTLKSMTLVDEKLHAAMIVETAVSKQNWVLNGTANPAEKTADILFSGTDSSGVKIPYLDQRFNLQMGFENVHLKLNQIELDGDELTIKGAASVKEFKINHSKIARQDVIVRNAEFDYSWLIGSNYWSLDSSSVINLNNFVVHPFVKYEVASPDTVFSFSVRTEKATAKQFIEALPDGLFTHIRGMEAEGSFSYRVDFVYNKTKPNDMVFESTLERDQFRITRFGEANLNKLNEEFVHYPYENGRKTRPIVVGPSNPNFTPLDQISPYLRNCVLTTEDPSFMYHRGFVTEAFRQSIAKNLRTMKFKRGASTISMQLIKNVFLTREKTMARKLEEILLVYILENNHLVPKNRMFEVYLNIIEWGPNVYGIGEASKYYFRKKPADLTLSECLYLATIIPRPKGFMWRFNKDGSPKDYLEKTYRYLANKMIFRQLITEQDTIGLTHRISITGPALMQIVKNDSLRNDSLMELELMRISNPETNDDQPADDDEDELAD
ncbi:MAG: transglycosylase domain-containing protein [Bacteroidia bacterium]|nr:transglycosylase domain-containing protein [Bacteroidia bacterium]